MMEQHLNAVGAGFGNETLGSQAVFRAALNALSLPGQWNPIVQDAQTPPQANAAAAALLLALLDADCAVWASPSLADGPALAWLRFHTGCRLVADASQAQFAWVAAADAVPELDSFSWGTDAYPDTACTVVLELDTMSGAVRNVSGAALTTELTGPGIATQQPLSLSALPDDFAAQWARVHAAFPRGLDVFMAQGDALLGLPRSTAMTQRQPQPISAGT